MDKSESEHLDTVHNIQSSNCGESMGDDIYENCNIESDPKPSIEAVYVKEEPCSYEFTEVNDDQCSEYSVSVEVKNEPCIDYDDLDSNIKKHDNLHHEVNDVQCSEYSASVVKNEPGIDYDNLDSNIKKPEDEVGPKSCIDITKPSQNDDSGTQNVSDITKQADHCKGNVAFVYTTQSQLYNCTVCSKKFINSSSLKQHLFIHRSSKYQCSLCSKAFSRASTLARHSLTHIGVKHFKCGQCEKRYSEAGNLKRHTLIHSNNNPFKCTLCSEGFVNSALLQKHLLTHRDVPKAPTQIAMPEMDSMQCSSNLKPHITRKPYKCDLCMKSYTQQASLARHSLLHSDMNLYKCSQCEKSYVQQASLSRHSWIHSEANPYKCSQCNTSFSTSALLQKHILTHVSKTHPQIDLQEIESSSSSGDVQDSTSLQKNSIIYDNAKYRCSHCAKVWPDAKSLKRHATTHIVIKRYICNYCDKSYTDRSNLIRHSAIHSDSKSYKCSQCNEGFCNSTILKKHLLTHSSAEQTFPV